MSIENAEPTTTKKPQSSALAISGAGGLSGILIAFANIQFKDSEYLVAITTTIPFVVGVIIAGLEYFLTYIGIRNKAELRVDNKLNRKLSNVNKYIKQAKKNIEKDRKLNLDTSQAEKHLSSLYEQRQQIQLAHLSVDDTKISTVNDA